MIYADKIGRPLIPDWCFHGIVSNMAFACVYMLAQQDGHSSAKNVEKKELGIVFWLFWININQQMMDYLRFGMILFKNSELVGSKLNI